MSIEMYLKRGAGGKEEGYHGEGRKKKRLAVAGKSQGRDLQVCVAVMRRTLERELDAMVMRGMRSHTHLPEPTRVFSKVTQA